MRTQSSVMECPRSMVGRVIGAAYSVNLAVSIITDIIRGSFKGFALLRQATRPPNGRSGYPAFTEPRPVYAPGYGLIPASQLYDDRAVPPPAMGTPYGLRPAETLQHVYPLMATGLPGQSVLGTMSLVNAQLQQLAMPAGDLGSLAGGAMQYQEATYMPVLPMAAGGGHGGHGGGGGLPMGNSEDFAVSASHRLIQAAGGGRGNVRPKPWLG
ncbi:hypothetical protein GPECTOR_21g640 [Gonium pectorale]|uniref:Uncharacterized protein n=1 Tax=Gonium pectorale TaxID=33097 RepID=A0A150GHW9_GONPE|nr:hypothetical protein GPECTOR_21g640 [Gonium pectorale]|eukprot:KXZ49414.1 hypothetical protein GPECTOR_21g640 [Gonium pectorale]